jgi:hypothetical protein
MKKVVKKMKLVKEGRREGVGRGKGLIIRRNGQDALGSILILYVGMVRRHSA